MTTSEGGNFCCGLAHVNVESGKTSDIVGALLDLRRSPKAYTIISGDGAGALADVLQNGVDNYDVCFDEDPEVSKLDDDLWLWCSGVVEGEPPDAHFFDDMLKEECGSGYYDIVERYKKASGDYYVASYRVREWFVGHLREKEMREWVAGHLQEAERA